MDHVPLTPAPARLSRTTLAAYAAPALPLAVLTLPLYVILPTYYAASLGVSLTAVGQALLLVRLFDALNDPLIGILADRTRPRFGRRRTWFLSAIPIIILAVWMLFVPPEGVGATWLLAFGALLSVGTTAVLVPYWAWGAELATDYGGRSRVAGAREAVVVVGTLFATATPAVTEAMGAADAGTALLILAIGVAVLLPASASAAVFLVPEPAEYSRQRQGVLAGLVQMRRNRPFLRLLAAYVLNGFANGLPATLFLFFVGQRLQAPEWAGAILFAYFLSGVAGVPLWLAVSHRLGKHRTWSIAMIGACAVFALVPALGPGDASLFLAVAVLTGLALGADLVLPSSIQADVIDVDTAASGEQRTGAYVAAWGLGTKLALALAVGVAFPVLDWAGFDANGGEHTPFALTTLAVLYAAVPVVMKMAAIALMWNFPLGARDHAALRVRIEAAG